MKKAPGWTHGEAAMVGNDALPSVEAVLWTNRGFDVE